MNENNTELNLEDSEFAKLTEDREYEKPEYSDCHFKDPPTKKIKKIKSEERTKLIENRMDEAYKFFKQISETPDKDECSLYTDLLCAKLRKFDENKREIAMREIDNVMYRLKHLENQIVQTPLPPSYYPNIIPSYLQSGYTNTMKSPYLPPTPFVTTTTMSTSPSPYLMHSSNPLSTSQNSDDSFEHTHYHNM